MFIDSHAHLTSSQVFPEIDGVLSRAKNEDVEQIINICTDPQTLELGLALAEKHPWIFNTAATTPHDVEKEGELFFPMVKEQALKKKLVALGETGLDYHYEHSPKALQKEFLARYFLLSYEVKLPLIFHCRDAFDDLFSMADIDYKDRPAILHCFTGTLDDAKEVIRRGWLISFSGIITFKNSVALRDVVRWAPLDQFLIETDTPYLAPQKHRGKPNEPAFIKETAECIAQIKGISVSEVANASADNARRFFALSKHL